MNITVNITMQKLLKRIQILLFVYLVFFVLQSCINDSDDTLNVPATNTIVDIALGSEDFTSLVAALQKTDLVSTLQGDGPFTVFAPTNEAFQNLLDSNPSWSSLDDIPVSTLKTVLLFHVLNRNLKELDIPNPDSYLNTLAVGPNDEPLTLQVEGKNNGNGEIEFNGDSKPIIFDIEASNGTVHAINKVMLPPNIVTLTLNFNYTSLVAALTDSRHTTNFISILNGNGPFTLFAPTNQAFQLLLNSNPDWNSLADVPIKTLEAVLLYHVVDKSNIQLDQLSNGDVSTLRGAITIDLTYGPKIKTTKDQTVDIVLNDIQGFNGVVHVINSVLLP
jgi:transforming growth factor-beta-induced protein